MSQVGTFGFPTEILVWNWDTIFPISDYPILDIHCMYLFHFLTYIYALFIPQMSYFITSLFSYCSMFRLPCISCLLIHILVYAFYILILISHIFHNLLFLNQKGWSFFPHFENINTIIHISLPQSSVFHFYIILLWVLSFT